MRLTPDVTYQGSLLTERAYAASVRLLGEFARGPVSALRATTLAYPDEVYAWCALQQCGVVAGRAFVTRDFTWDGLRLTEYGKEYARQRGVETC